VPSIGAFAVDRVRRSDDAKGVLVLRAQAEQTPKPDSRVTLGTRRDAFGLPVARLDWRPAESDRASIRASQKVVDAALRAAGVGRVELMLGDERPPVLFEGDFHHLGTTRMHADPHRGVVDADCRVHGLRNLYIAGSSVFPTFGCSNPTLTVVALALRLADHLRRSWRAHRCPSALARLLPSNKCERSMRHQPLGRGSRRLQDDPNHHVAHRCGKMQQPINRSRREQLCLARQRQLRHRTINNNIMIEKAACDHFRIFSKEIATSGLLENAPIPSEDIIDRVPTHLPLLPDRPRDESGMRFDHDDRSSSHAQHFRESQDWAWQVVQAVLYQDQVVASVLDLRHVLRVEDSRLQPPVKATAALQRLIGKVRHGHIDKALIGEERPFATDTTAHKEH
jgi:GMC oxidoreductase